MTASGEAFRPQQAVVRLTSLQTGAAAYFAATRNKDGSLSANIKSAGVEKQIGTQVGWGGVKWARGHGAATAMLAAWAALGSVATGQQCESPTLLEAQCRMRATGGIPAALS